MDLDNPSYFSLENATARQQSNRISLQRISKSGGGGSSTSSASSVSSLSRQLTPPRNKGKKMKSLARSMSSNSNESYHLIMQGEARLSDMAPDIAAKYSKRSNSIPINFLKQPQMYSALPTSEECADSQDNSEDEVFVGEDSARYYNFSAMAHRGNPRRHSIGTFMGPRDRTGSMTSSLRSFKREEDVPQVVQKEVKPSSSTVVLDDHSLRHAMYPRRRCKLCVREYSQKMANMDDILIVSLKCSSAATLWVDYFSSYFLQISKQANRKPFKIHQLSVEEFAEAKEEERNIYIEKSSGVKLQIVVVCPGFLEYVAESQNANIGKLFLPDRTLALLLGVSDSDIYETHRNVLSTYFKWQRMSVGQDQDENFTKEFVGEAMSIFSRIWKQQTTQIAQDKAGFSVSPKKIRPGQSSVFILLTHPLQKDDVVKISIEKNNEIHVIPNLKRRNPYTIKISVPDTYTEVTAIINILVEKNGSIIGARPVKCESRLRELEQILRFTDHPVEFMCQGQSSVFILLTHPLQKDDVVKISIEKNNEIHVIPNLKRRNPYTIKISVPDTYTEVTAIINILVEKNGNIIGARPVKCESRLRELEQILRFTDHPVEFMCQGQSSVFILLTHPLQKDDVVIISIEKNNEIHVIPNLKRRNPYTIKISVPDTYTEVTAIINILVEKNGSIIGARPVKCESRLRELEQILRFTDHPVEFMCQTLGFTPADKEHLDNWLVQNFQRNLPPHFNLLANSTSPFAAGIQAQKHSYEEYPTLLHFAAKFGLEKLAMQLLDCPGADVAYDIKNIFNLTPAQIAESNNHPELASLLRGYMNMNEFTSMYSKLKEISLSAPPGDCITDEQGYLTPKNFDELYKLCPAPRPVTLNLRRDSHDSNECLTPLGYMAMKTPTPVKEEEPKPEEKRQTKQSHINQTIKTPVLTPTTPNSPNINDLTSTQIKEVEDKVQKELLEIINDFKNNVHSIGQVEKLVDEWKNRNDVQKSFQEKQDQLREMRIRYEEIQRQMKAALKKPSPFDRVKKLFSRSKSREDADSVLTSQDLRQNPNQQRPISSLSISSSGSSGRMSTISGSSLGDSGTHSDNEERKNALKCSEDDFKNELHKAIMELNYTPVPAPKPFKPASISINSQRNKLTTTIEESPSTSSQTISSAQNQPQDQYYIQFPASGLPVPGTSAMGLFEAAKKLEEMPRCFGKEYMNVNSSCLQEISEVPHEYMNFKAPV